MHTNPDLDALDRHIGLKLRRLRNNKRYSLEQPAEWLDISKQQMSRLEQGKSRLSVGQLYVLARGFDVPFSWFVEGFVADAVNRQWQETMLGEARDQWRAVSDDNYAEQLIALWKMLDNRAAKTQLLGLLRALTNTL